jgi:hypothetical protein
MKRYISLETLAEVRATAARVEETPRRDPRSTSGVHDRSQIDEALRCAGFEDRERAAS